MKTMFGLEVSQLAPIFCETVSALSPFHTAFPAGDSQ